MRVPIKKIVTSRMCCLQKMQYDLGDCTLWEFMFPSNDKPVLQLPDEERFDEFDEEEV